MTHDTNELASRVSTGEELRYLRNYIDRNNQEMRLLSEAIGELEGVIAEADHYLTNGIAYLGVKSLKKKLEEELTEKALKSIEIKEKYGEFLAFAVEAGEWT
jgi:hypothetical protein|tara:strand:+ start:146 stop:451 length:306 start_codon:yes stop_codon:yes gene_type:complete